jgi:hypothetical protein
MKHLLDLAEANLQSAQRGDVRMAQRAFATTREELA